MINFKETIQQKEYDFLRENKYLKDNIMLLTLGGSHAYGLQKEDGTSDIDVRGITTPTSKRLLGFNDFEQFIDKATDTTIYDFDKIIKLLLNCNSNVVEMLFCKDEHYLLLNKYGKILLENRKLFLSQKAVNSFGSYAFSQLNRLNNSLARDSFDQIEKEEHILNSMKSATMGFNYRFKDFVDSEFNIYIDESEKEDLDNEIFTDINLKHYPIRDFKNIVSELNNIIRDYDKINHRNNKAPEKLSKHICHLFRLYIMAIEILTEKNLTVYIEKEHNFLMDLRNDKYVTQKSDGTLDYSFVKELLIPYQEQFEYAKLHTNLPKIPNLSLIEEMVCDIKRDIILNNT